MRTSTGIVVLALCLAGAAGGEKAPAVKLKPDEQKLLDLLNADRKKEKLPPLTLNATLCRVARAHSENMARHEKMAHELDGKRPGDRVLAAGYDYRSVGENLGKSEAECPDQPNAAAADPVTIHAAWMKSKAHRDNILAARFTEVGLAVVRSKKGTDFYTQVFARPQEKP